MLVLGRAGSVQQAMATYDTAQSLELTIGPEATAELMAAQKRPPPEEKKTGMFSSLFGAFSSDKKK